MGRKTVRVLVCGAVCMAVLSTVGHAFAFFWASSEAGGTQVQMGGVALRLEELPDGGVRALEWTGLYTAHVSLEQQCRRIATAGGTESAVQHALDANFSAWWREHQEGLGGFLRESATASSGGLLSIQYVFVNESTVPVYLRMQKPQVRVAGGEEAPLHAAVLAWEGGPESWQHWPYDSANAHLLVDGGPEDGYLYLEYPVAPGKRVSITCVAYILSRSNGNRLQGGEAAFVAGCVELIQAQNNAVYLDDAWKRAADNGVNFAPYTETHGGTP